MVGKIMTDATSAVQPDFYACSFLGALRSPDRSLASGMLQVLQQLAAVGAISNEMIDIERRVSELPGQGKRVFGLLRALARGCARCGSQLPTLTGIRLAHAEAIMRHEVGSWSRSRSWSCSWLYRGLVVVSAAGLLFTEAVGVGVGVGA